jgi:hypothetical protein
MMFALARATALAAALALPALGAPSFSLHPQPVLSLPWAEHGLFSSFERARGLNTEAYVVPQRPGKNQVRYFDYHWRDFDFLDEDGSAGVRFYFYDREYPVARIAAGLVRQSWSYLTDRFGYKPSFKVPYILYNTYREFLETNVFQLSEGTLGVTSPQDLRMTLPYFGEREMFRHTSTHEMTHQFQIQKMAERSHTAGMESAITAMPLWFIEGLAEYYSNGQAIDAETDMFLRDLVINPIGEIGYDMPSLLEDRPYSFLYTYKYGQARLVFLAETYGERVIQAVLDQSPRLAGSARRGEAREGFGGLLARIAGEQPQQMDARWRTWLRKRVLPGYLGSKQDLPDVTELKLPDELDAFTSTTDGNLLFYRGVERDSGRAKLVLIDRRDPTSARQLAIDQHPGTESLHPVLRSVMAVHDTGVAWFAQSGDSDVLHYRHLLRRANKDEDSARTRHDLNLGPDTEILVVRDGIIEAGDPSFSPDGKRLAFYGLDRDGKIDIYILDLTQPGARSQRLTEDLYSERDLSWGEDGIVYASDATESGKYNLFRIDPDRGTRVRLTDAPVDQRYPVALAGGAVLFSSAAGGKFDLWFLQNGRIKRISDFATGITHPGLSPAGIYGVAFYGARFRLIEVASPDMLSLEEQDAIPAAYTATINQPLPFPDEPIPYQTIAYNPFDLGKNWRIEGGGAQIGGAGIGFAPVGAGGVSFADIMRDRSFLATLAIYGSFDLTDALAFYVDRAHRLSYGVGLFNTFQQGRDTRFPSATQCGTAPPAGQQNFACQVFYLQRQFGGMGLISYPFSTFSRVEAELRVQGISRSLVDNGVVDQFYQGASLPASELNSITGFDPETETTLSWGYDTTRYGPVSGAIGGGSILLQLGGGFLPARGEAFTFFQEDAIYTIKIAGRAKIGARAAMGLAQGSRFGRHFYLSSFDNLRGFRFTDPKLLGDAYYVGQTEFAFPLDALVRFAVFSGITGIVGLDFGGVIETNSAYRNHPDYGHPRAIAAELWSNRTMDYVLGANFALGPFELRVQFAHGIDIGGLIPEVDEAGKPTWVPNISLRYAYF